MFSSVGWVGIEINTEERGKTMTDRLNLHTLDVSDGSLFGGPGAPAGSVTVAIADMTYDGQDHRDAMRKRAVRQVGGSGGRVVRTWRYYDCPAVTVLVFDADMAKAFGEEQ